MREKERRWTESMGKGLFKSYKASHEGAPLRIRYDASTTNIHPLHAIISDCSNRGLVLMNGEDSLAGAKPFWT